MNYTNEQYRYWFYSYDNSAIINNNTHYSINDIDDNINGVTEKVKYCKRLDNNTLENDIPINTGLRSNREMSYNQMNQWLRPDEYDWFVLPRIKIDPAYANDQSHNDEVVCKIVVTGWNGETEEEYDIKVRNFKQQENASYDGSYFESFYMAYNSEKEYFNIPKSKLPNFTTTESVWIYGWGYVPCGCDIKVYWTGNCDIWLDRIRIENEPAHQFMTLDDSWHQELIDKLDAEISWAQTQGNIPNYFYFEECFFSHFPAIREINNRVKLISNNKNEMVIWLNYDMVNVHIPYYDQHWLTASQLYKFFHDDFGINTMVMGSYALEGQEKPDARYSNHPNTLLSSGYNTTTGVLSYAESPSVYDAHLQDQLDNNVGGTGLIFVNRLMSELSKMGMRIINCPQAHGWYKAGGHKLKEPSNQELELQANLALSYNAKGIIYFCYNSFYVSPDEYAFGIMDGGYVPRTNSVYSQDKFGGIQTIDTKISEWAPYVYNFDPEQTKTCIYRNTEERQDFLSNSYFGDIISYRYITGDPLVLQIIPGILSPEYFTIAIMSVISRQLHLKKLDRI